MQCPWGQKAFRHYLGEDQQNWRQHDAIALIEDGRLMPGLIDRSGLGRSVPDATTVPRSSGKSMPRSGVEADAAISQWI